MRFFVLIASATVVAATNNFGMSPELKNEIEHGLMTECGEKCLNFWKQVEESSNPGESVKDALKREMNEKKEQFQALTNAVNEKTSYMKSFPLDVPCYDAGSCAVVETLSNACSYSRLAAMGAYQSLNIAVHTFAVVTKMICACVDVMTSSKCLLKEVQPWVCEPVNNLYLNLLGMSDSSWQAVKAQTTMCKVTGDARVLVG